MSFITSDAYRPYLNEQTNMTVFLTDEQMAALPPEAPIRRYGPGDTIRSVQDDFNYQAMLDDCEQIRRMEGERP